MAYVDWLIKGPKIVSCSCDYGCPCEFNGRPSRGHCEGLEAHLIEEGHFGDVRLDGLIVVGRYRWPGAVHEGKGVVQGVIDERASEAQREALFKILGGEEQEPTTVFNMYGSTIETEIDPIFAPIEFECDIEARRARFAVPGLIECAVEPIKNPVTGKDHRAIIRLPEGVEFRDAEMGSGTFSASGDLPLDYQKCYASLFHVAYGPHGIVE